VSEETKTQDWIDAMVAPKRTFQIPESNLEHIYELMADNSALGSYRLWSEIRRLFPDVAGGPWYLHATDPFHLFAVEGQAPKSSSDSLLNILGLGHGRRQ
jgi:hypothetical protein